MTNPKADWLEPRDAAEIVVRAVQPLDAIRCALADSRGHVLAEPVIAGIDLPRWNNSGMDGFAVRSEDVAGASRDAPVVLRVVEDVPAGTFPSLEVVPGTAARVMTGAPVPSGADSVIRVEHTDGAIGMGSTEARVTILDPQDAGRNVRFRGEDIRAGATALPAGTLMTPAAIGVAASLGYTHLGVIRRPKVALLTSGDELVEVDDFAAVEAGRKIVSSNSYTLAAQLAAIGCEVRYLGIARDSRESLANALEGARGCDALITSAGISVGEHDYVREVLQTLGTQVAFWRVRIKPGSPFAFGSIAALDGIPWFGLPGNPVSSMVTFELFARPALLRMMGHSRIFRRPVPARLVEKFEAQAGLTQFVRVRLEEHKDGVGARLTGPQGSGILTSAALADGLMIIPPNAGRLQAGDPVSVLPLEGSGHSFLSSPHY